MTMRTTMTDASRRSQTSIGRCTLREFDDDHDMMQIKTADVMHGESATDFERWQQSGMSVHPMPQDQKQQQQGGQGGQGGGGGGGGSTGGDKIGFNDNQPTEPSAEGIMLYVGGSRAHPVCIGVDDRRVRPYQTKPGECLYYSADGSGQTIYHRVRGDGADGLYMLTLDDTQSSGHGPNGRAGQPQTRHISIRHANKPKQQRKKDQMQSGQGGGGGGGGGGGAQALTNGGGGGQQQQDYKHEGESINTEQTFSKGEIRWNDSGGTKGRLAVGGDWLYHDGSGAKNSMRADKEHSHIRNEGADVWVKKGVCYKSVPFVLKPDPCDGK